MARPLRVPEPLITYEIRRNVLEFENMKHIHIHPTRTRAPCRLFLVVPSVYAEVLGEGSRVKGEMSWAAGSQLRSQEV